jgi:hypothetical protein
MAVLCIPDQCSYDRVSVEYMNPHRYEGLSRIRRDGGESLGFFDKAQNPAFSINLHYPKVASLHTVGLNSPIVNSHRQRREPAASLCVVHFADMAPRQKGYALRPVFLQCADVLGDAVGCAVLACICAAVSQWERLEELFKIVPEC